MNAILRHFNPKEIVGGVILERDLFVTMQDGVRLATNVFRPTVPGKYPVILSVTPYSKDKLPDRKSMFFMRLAGVRFGNLCCSRWTGFEAPDPLYWVKQGYVVMQSDVRGMHKSEGSASVLSDQDAQDYAALIAWAAAQTWSNGNVGLLGVSYLAMSQWRVAALQPPALKAICPWEGATDMLREFGYQDGVPETGFIPTWWKHRIISGRNKQFPLAEDFPAEVNEHPCDGAFWVSKKPVLENIQVPALVCGSWSDHGLHTRGSFVGFERISSQHKWLFTHGRRKWETFYDEESLALQTKFFDHFLKGHDNQMQAVPKVRLERRRSFYQADIRFEDVWPLKTMAIPLYLSGSTGTLNKQPVQNKSSVLYSSADKKTDKARFSLSFDQDTELTGSMRLKLWVSATEADDMDIFATVHKFDAQGYEVFFAGYNGFAHDCAAKGWLRASHRELDSSLSTNLRPWHTHRTAEKVKPETIVPVEIEILPSSTFFESGSSLSLDIQAHDASHYPAFAHDESTRHGSYYVHCGGQFDSQFVIPYIESGFRTLPPA